MKVLITGANGQLGFDVSKRLTSLGIVHKGIDIADCDLTNREQTIAVLTAYAPDCVVHCAAYTAVDKAESNREVCFAVNVEGTRNVALACKRLEAKMIYISTDYVFPGEGDMPYEVDDAKGPLSVYGETKYQGELAVQELIDQYYIVRISWAFGLNGNNFVKTMLRLGKEKSEVNVVCDQIGSPTYTEDLAALLCDMLQTEKYGVYHATNEGYCSWYEFAKRIMELAQLPCKVYPVTSAGYPVAAKRPLNSRLSKRALIEAGFMPLPAWQDALERFIQKSEFATQT